MIRQYRISFYTIDRWGCSHDTESHIEPAYTAADALVQFRVQYPNEQYVRITKIEPHEQATQQP